MVGRRSDRQLLFLRSRLEFLFLSSLSLSLRPHSPHFFPVVSLHASLIHWKSLFLNTLCSSFSLQGFSWINGSLRGPWTSRLPSFNPNTPSLLAAHLFLVVSLCCSFQSHLVDVLVRDPDALRRSLSSAERGNDWHVRTMCISCGLKQEGVKSCQNPRGIKEFFVLKTSVGGLKMLICSRQQQ